MPDLNELRERFDPITEETLQKVEEVKADTVGQIEEAKDTVEEQVNDVKDSVEARLARLESKFHAFEPIMKFLHERITLLHRLLG